MKLTERHHEILVAISRGLNGQRSAESIAWQLGYKPAKTGRLAVSASLRSLERNEFVGRIAPFDQWCSATWFLMPAGRSALSQNEGDRK